MLSHTVFFTLKDSSSEACDQLVAACHKYLKQHDGIRLLSAGPRTPDLQRPVNDQEFHVALVVVFESREAHDVYQVSENHEAFIAEQKHNWETVRVFDADVS